MEKILKKCNWYDFLQKYKGVLTVSYGQRYKQDKPVEKKKKGLKRSLKVGNKKDVLIEYQDYIAWSDNRPEPSVQETEYITCVRYKVTLGKKEYSIYSDITTNSFIQSNEYGFKSYPSVENDRFTNGVFIKIKDYKLSSTIFGYKLSKKAMMESGNLYLMDTIHEDYLCKKDGVNRDVFEISNGEKKLKFVIDDLEFIYPDIDKLMKGYNAPKDRIIKKGSNVSLVRNGGLRLPVKAKGVVLEVVNSSENNTKRYYDVSFKVNDNVEIHRIKYGKLKVI